MNTLLDSIVNATTTQSVTAKPRRARPSADTIRAREDADMAARAGFGLPEPVYALGSPVNATGHDNARRGRLEWAAKPQVPAAMDDLIARIDGEKRKDITVPIRDLSLNGDTGRLQRVGNGKLGLLVDKLAWSQLLALTPYAPSYAAGYLADLDPSWRAEEWARIAKRAATLGDPDASVVLRVRCPEGDTQRATVYATVSEAYTVFGVKEGAAVIRRMALRGQLPGDLRCDVAYRGGSATISLEGFSDVRPENYVAGEIFKAGMSVQLTDDKTGKDLAFANLVRNLCLNLIILGEASQTLFAISHRASAQEMEAALVNGLRRGDDLIGGFLRQWDTARVDALDVIAAARALTAAEDGAKKSAALVAVPGVAPETLLEWIVEGYKMEPEANRAGLVNAISRAPQIGTWADPIAAEDTLAKAAARVLEMVDLPAMVAARN